MKQIFLTPGPSQLYPTFQKHLMESLKENIPSMSHRSKGFMDLFEETRQNLSRFLDVPKSHKIYFLSSATECMERIIQSTVYKHSFHFINGAFSKLFYDIAIKLNKKSYSDKTDPGTGFSFRDVSIPENTELICFTHNETSTGVSLDLNDVTRYVKRSMDQLFALDIVSSAPYIKVDFSKFDLVFFSVQKGFGLPAGLGIMIVSPKAYKKAFKVLNDNKISNSYHDFLNLEKYSELHQTPETPNVLLIYLFNKIIKDMMMYGIDKIRTDTEIKSGLIYDYFDKSNYLTPFVKDNEDRSKTVCVADTNMDSGLIVSGLKEYGYVIGSGYKDKKSVQIRIANFPTQTVLDIKKLIDTLELVCRKFK